MIVRDVIAMLEKQSGKYVKCFQSNNGTEFINLMINLFCRKNRIIHETTNPYLSEQNSIIEHVITIFFKMVYCMLHVVSIDLYY